MAPPDWRENREAKAFYWAIALQRVLGAALNFSSINPMDALYWSAVITGSRRGPDHGRDDADGDQFSGYGATTRSGPGSNFSG